MDCEQSWSANIRHLAAQTSRFLRDVEALSFASLLVMMAGALYVAPLFAGGGPQNVVVAINSQSDASKRIANVYAELRQVPDSHLIRLDNVPDGEITDVETFRETILKPLLAEIDKRGIASRVDCIAYSADFPTAIRVKSDADALEQKLSKVITPVASINGLTYLAGLTLAKNPNYLSLSVNNYMALSPQVILQLCCVGERQEKFIAARTAYKKQEYETARATFEELQKVSSRQPELLYWLARCYSHLEEDADALDWLKSAAKAGWCFRAFTTADPAFERLAENKDFLAALQEIPDSKLPLTQSRGFHARDHWVPSGMRTEKPEHGARYILSTVLAVTRGAGTTEEEAIDSLKLAASADGTKPQGTFYFTLTGDVRTKTRQPNFADTIAELERLGHKAEIVEDVLPKDRDDVVGAMIGRATFDWPASGSTILPGAICENLTSFGGKMDQVGGQTKLSQLILAGAAGSSGTVTEPYAIQAKFPHPSMQVHYARGCSLAESFYQSVHGPYQLLIVGDPLCQPWATPPRFELKGLRSDEEVSKTVVIEEQPDGSTAIEMYEYFLDGRLLVVRVNQEMVAMELDTTTLADGYHELRVVAIGAQPVETQSHKIIPFNVNNNGQSLKLVRVGDEPLTTADNMTLRIDSNVDAPVHLVHAGQQLATFEKSDKTVTIDCHNLGSGPVRLHVEAEVKGKRMYSAPLELEISPSTNEPMAP